MKTATLKKIEQRPPVETYLTPRQVQLYKMFKFDQDEDIEELYLTMFGPPETQMRLPQMQMHLGSFISKMNRRIRQYGEAVKPGVKKHTYRLTAI